jgi:hypothetical protein
VPTVNRSAMIEAAAPNIGTGKRPSRRVSLDIARSHLAIVRAFLDDGSDL